MKSFGSIRRTFAGAVCVICLWAIAILPTTSRAAREGTRVAQVYGGLRRLWT